MAEPEPHTPRTTEAGDDSIRPELSRDEFQLTLTALRLLLSTLGREEADELEQVRGLLARLERLRR
jgi:hypothetical protein